MALLSIGLVCWQVRVFASISLLSINLGLAECCCINQICRREFAVFLTSWDRRFVFHSAEQFCEIQLQSECQNRIHLLQHEPTNPSIKMCQRFDLFFGYERGGASPYHALMWHYSALNEKISPFLLIFLPFSGYSFRISIKHKTQWRRYRARMYF